MTDFCLTPAHELARLLREKRLSAVELLGQHEARHARLNPGLNAVVATDFAAARIRAEAADAAIARGESWGPLHGLPITLKDTWEVAGFTTVVGSPSLKDYRPKATAPAVQRLVDAGAIVLGKTNTPLFASDVQTFNRVYGTTNNPWDATRTPGGSSGGAAAAVAAGLATLELGSDLAGSIRLPAHFCGIYGHKPSRGLVPMRGHVPGMPGTLAESDLVVAGPMARSAEDLALMLPLLAGPLAPEAAAWTLDLPAAPARPLAQWRIHACLDDPSAPLDPAVRDTLGAAVEKLRQAGCRVETGPIPGVDLDAVYEDYFALMSALFGPGLNPKKFAQAAWGARFAGLFGRDRPNSLGRFLRHTTASHRDWLIAHERREKLRARLTEWLSACDVLLMPVSPTAAPPHTQKGLLYSRRIAVGAGQRPYADQFRWIALATLAGLPATTLPAGQTGGLPVGLQAIGAPLHDLTTIEFARLAAPVLGGFQAPPSATA